MKLRHLRHRCCSLFKLRSGILITLIFVISIIAVCYRALTPHNFDQINIHDLSALKRQDWRFFYHATTYYAGNNWRDAFVFSNCLKYKCAFVQDSSIADAVLFHMGDVFLQWWTHVPRKLESQVWILYGQESPTTTLWNTKPLDGYFNWTLSHQRNSDLVVTYTSSGTWRRKSAVPRQFTDYWTGRTGGAFIVTSNCWTASGRMQYIEELSRYYPVDIYGGCGKSCKTRPDDCNFTRMAREYKFYLSFENSLCKDYISEKYFRNALSEDIVPIVRGGRKREDYERVSPPNSFIYADDFRDAKQLALYLKKVGQDKNLYNKMLEWKNTHEFIHNAETIRLGCVLCAAIHNRTLMRQSRIHHDLSQMWNRHRDCRDPVVLPDRNIFTKMKHYALYLLNIN